MAQRRIIIFGCGYVGRQLAAAAVQRGREVWVHSRNADSLSQVAEVPAERKIVGDLQDSAWHDELSGDWDLAFNLVSSAGGGIDGYRLSYVEGNRSIRDWARHGRVSRFIYSSATSVYPQSEGEWVAENDVPDDPAKLSPSGRLLRQSELEILESTVYPERIVARLAGIYGPGRHLYLNRLRENADSISGDGSGWLNLIFLEDIVEALLCLAEADLEEKASVFNVVDDEPSRKQEIVDWLAGELGVESIPFDPSASGSRASRRKVQGALPNRRVSNAKIRKQVGWQPAFPDFKAGYRKILKAL